MLGRYKVDIIVLTCMVLFLLIMPLAYGFDYPFAGPDTANHIETLDKLVTGEAGVMDLQYLGPLLLYPFAKAGASSLTLYIVLTYVGIMAGLACTYLVVRNTYGRLPAILALTGLMFLAWGLFFLFKAGTLFNIVGLLVLIPAIAFFLSQYLSKGGKARLLAIILLLLAGAVLHSLTFLYILATLLTFLTGYTLYYYRRKESTRKPLTVLTILLALAVPVAWVTWGSTSFLLTGQGHASPVSQGLGVHSSFIVYIYFLSLPLLVFLIGLGLVLRDRSKNYLLKTPITFFFLSLLIALLIGLVIERHERLLWDLSSVLVLLGTTVIGVYFRKPDWKVAIQRLGFMVLILISVAAIPAGVYGWTSDYSTYRPVDKLATNYINEVEAETVLLSPQIYYRVYRLFSEGTTFQEANYEEVDSLHDFEYFIHRSEYMDCKVEYLGQEFPEFNLGFIETEGLVQVQSFREEDISIDIYRIP